MFDPSGIAQLSVKYNRVIVELWADLEVYI